MKVHWLAWGLALSAMIGVARPASAACTLNRMAELPVTMLGMRPTIPVSINGAEVRLTVDSGAFFSIISPGVAAQYGLHLEAAPYNMYMRGIGGNASISVATVKTFGLAGAKLANIPFIVGGSEVGTAGLLGQNVLGIADVEYDLPDGFVRIMRPKGCEKANFAYWAGDKPYSVIEIEQRSPSQPHTIGTVLVNGTKIRAIFDTGAATSMLSLAAAARAGIKPDSPGVEPGGFIGGLGRKRVETWIAPVQSFAIDGEQILRSHIRIGAMDLPNGDMLIGADFFLSHRIYVANGIGKLFLTYNGGSVFDLTTHAGEGPPKSVSGADGPAPTDAEGFSRRGAILASQHDVAGATADFTHAIEMAPTIPLYLVQRAQLYRQTDRREEAMADLDKALKLAPDDLEALLARAGLRLRAKDRDAAVADLDTAARVAAKSADERLRIGMFYDGAGRLDAAIEQYSLWITAHPDDVRRPEALNGRCWARALLGKDLDKALADCDSAVRAGPRIAAFLDSRGLVHLRMGDDDKAIRDYDAALAIQPKQPWSLYGRGLAKLRKGLAVDGQADVAAAKAIQPDIVDKAKGYGIVS